MTDVGKVCRSDEGKQLQEDGDGEEAMRVFHEKSKDLNTTTVTDWHTTKN
jgi:hypothetical protein